MDLNDITQKVGKDLNSISIKEIGNAVLNLDIPQCFYVDGLYRIEKLNHLCYVIKPQLIEAEWRINASVN